MYVYKLIFNKINDKKSYYNFSLCNKELREISFVPFNSDLEDKIDRVEMKILENESIVTIILKNGCARSYENYRSIYEDAEKNYPHYVTKSLIQCRDNILNAHKDVCRVDDNKLRNRLMARLKVLMIKYCWLMKGIKNKSLDTLIFGSNEFSDIEQTTNIDEATKHLFYHPRNYLE